MAITPPVVVIVGQTGSGKSALALELAKKFAGEIICADARTVYRGMDIGTAKPSSTERTTIPHHLIDMCSPNEQYTAAQFQADAQKSVGEIHKRGRLSIIVGGTGLYIDSFVFNYTFPPKTDVKMREKSQRYSPKELMLALDEANINYDHVDSKNPRRLQRLLETGGQTGGKTAPRTNTLLIGLEISRTELRRRIEQRVASMLRRGLVHEVKELVDRFGWAAAGLNTIGYKEWRPYFEGKISRAEVGRRIVKDTLDLAKRQRTWFKRHQMIVWVGSTDEAVQTTESFVASQASSATMMTNK